LCSCPKIFLIAYHLFYILLKNSSSNVESVGNSAGVVQALWVTRRVIHVSGTIHILYFIVKEQRTSNSI